MPNPLLAPWTTPFALPPFAEIRDDQFGPAIEAGLAEARRAIAAIADNPEAPTFANTIEALELSEETLDRVAGVFYNLAGATATRRARRCSASLRRRCRPFPPRS